MASASVSFKANAHFAETRRDRRHFLRQYNRFWGERIKGNVNSSLCVNQFATSLRTGETVKKEKAKPCVVSAVRAPNSAQESVVS